MTDTDDPGGSDAAPAPDAAPVAGDVPLVAHRAITAPATVDRSARTVEVVWSTGARARNYVPTLGLITEELEMSPNAVRMDALRSGNAPVLNTHRSMDARDVLGRVTAARIERGRGYATLQFSSAADVEPVWQRIADGTLRAIRRQGFNLTKGEVTAGVTGIAAPLLDAGGAVLGSLSVTLPRTAVPPEDAAAIAARITAAARAVVAATGALCAEPVPHTGT
jgi:hypothetical protein